MVRRLRKRAGLSQEALAEASGISASQITHVETGRRNLSYDSAEALGRALDLDQAELDELHAARREHRAIIDDLIERASVALQRSDRALLESLATGRSLPWSAEDLRQMRQRDPHYDEVLAALTALLQDHHDRIGTLEALVSVLYEQATGAAAPTVPPLRLLPHAAEGGDVAVDVESETPRPSDVEPE